MATSLSEAHAKAVDLEYLTGSRAVEVFHRMKTLEQGDSIGSKVLEQLWETGQGPPSLTFLPVSAAAGRFGGCETYLSTRLREPSHLMIFLLFPNPLEEKLLILPEGFVARLSKKLFKVQDLQSGNALLDPRVLIKSGNSEITQRRIASPKLQEALLAVFDLMPDAVVNDVGIRAVLSRPGVDELEEVLSRFRAVADSIH